MAVAGIDIFRDKFKDYPDCYTIIGGAACDILMASEELDFRATRDIDMILLIEDRFSDFAEVFWDYIKEGGYQCGWKSNEVHFYRFTDPRPGYPVQIELFSRKPDYHLAGDSRIVPIHIDDDISSLSVIMLNDDYYNFMMEGRTVIDGLSVLSAEYIIPFKMYAWLDLREKKKNGLHVNKGDIRKHKNDVFRLLQIVPDATAVNVSGMVGETVNSFLSEIQNEEIDLRSLGISLSRERCIDRLEQIYKVK